MKERKVLVAIQVLLVFMSVSSVTYVRSLDPIDLQWVAIDEEETDFPPARSYHEMVYDSKSDVVIMTHGQFSFPDRLPQETWVYSTNSSQWTNMNPEIIPDSRTGFGFAYDSKNDVSILFGGGNNNAKENSDTWSYNYTSNTWKNMKPQVSPTERVGHEMVFDSESGKIILFGGRENVLQDGYMYNDLWTYDYNNNLWENITPLHNPPARWYFSMVYDTKDDKTILFGGYSRIETIPYITRHDFKNDTWSFDLNTLSWTELTPVLSPNSRSYSSGAYQQQLDKFILYGGWNQDESIFFNDTWTFDYSTNTWVELNINAPNMRTHSTMIYNNESNKIVMYGGYFIPYSSYGDPSTWILEPKSNTSISYNSLVIIPTLVLVVLVKGTKRKV